MPPARVAAGCGAIGLRARHKTRTPNVRGASGISVRLNELYARPGYVVVTAHRGFSGQYPENTIEAFMAAVDLGADMIEFDVRGTKDGVPIVLHDSTFDRTANRPGRPQDYVLSEIKQFEASYWRGSHESGAKSIEPAAPGTGIPTFKEVLSHVGDEVGLNIQIYAMAPSILAEVCRLYRAYDLYDRGYLTMPGLKEAVIVKDLDAGIGLCVTERQGSMDVEALKRQRDFGCRYAQPLRRDVTPELCAAARELDLYANMFYSNTDADNRRYIEMGIQGILTDQPDVLIATLTEMGRRQRQTHAPEPTDRGG